MRPELLGGALAVLAAIAPARAAVERAPPLSPPPLVREVSPEPRGEPEFGRSDTGGAGLSSVRSAFIAPQSLVVSLRGSFFRSPAFTVSAGVDEYWLTQVGASFAPQDWLELALTLRSATLEQRASAQQHYFLVNDVFVRGKVVHRWLGGALSAGGEVWLRLPPPLLRADPLFEGLSPGFGGVASYDFARHGVPVVAHLNTGLFIDESVRFDDGSGDRSRQYALDIATYNRWLFGLGVEARLRAAGVGLRPFLELTVDAHLGAAGPPPVRLTPGLRVLPWKGLVVDGLVQLGLTHPTTLGVLPVPGWSFGVALGYQLSWAEVEARTEYVDKVRVVERIQRAPETHGSVKGSVRDGSTQTPVADAIIALAGHDRVLTNADGTFLVPHVEPGPVWVGIARQGFASKEVTGAVVAGQAVELAATLMPLPPPPPVPMTVRGTVLSESERPVEATVTAPGAGLARKADAAGQYLLTLPSGPQPIEVAAPGFQTQGRLVVGQQAESIVLDWVLKPIPKQLLVVLRKEKIEIKKQVHFATGKNVILPDSAQLLDQVSALILETDRLKLIRIEGHTDSDGDDAFNLDLSERRSQSVMRALIERGVEPTRLKAVGFGETRAIADNKKAAGRALNRRVEFMLESQD